jgi:drug/metabolite transporter (DMT)-like permease
MINWISLVLLSTLSYSVADIFQRDVYKKAPNMSVAFWTVITWIPEIIALFLYVTFSHSLHFLIEVFVSGAIFFLSAALFKFLSVRFLYQVFKEVEVSIITIIMMSSNVFSLMIGKFIFAESITLMQYIGSVILILGCIFIIRPKKDHFLVSKKNLLYLFLAAIGLSAGFAIDKYAGLNLDIFATRFWISLLTCALFLIFCFKDIFVKFKSQLNAVNILRVSFLITVLFYPIYALAQYFAFYHGASVFLVDVLNNLSLVFILILEILFLKERDNLLQKIIATGIVGVGAVLLAF